VRYPGGTLAVRAFLLFNSMYFYPLAQAARGISDRQNDSEDRFMERKDKY
jgi:hypothetical protein